jgi:hypothetical protein
MINATPGFQSISSLSSVWAMMEAARSGASDATDSARSALPAAARAVSATASATGFAIGFAACFPVFLMAGLMPKNNPLVHGLADGGRAGLDLARQTIRPASPAAAPLLALAATPSG